MKKQHIIIILFFVLVAFCQQSFAQTDTIDIESMTKEDVMALSYDQLLELPFEDLLQLADIVGVSLEELYELILNKDVVSASKKIESSFEAPLSTSVISYEEIMASGARTIEEALRLVPGMIVREKTSGNFDVHIRGNDNVPPNHMYLYSENSNSLVMINGRPVYNYAHGGTFWETLPIGIEDIDRIEVVRGPSSALYGPNAVSGVVNIITKDIIEQELKVKANAEIGTQNNQRASLRIQKKVTPKLGMAVTGNFYHADRNTDELYVHELEDYISKAELDTVTKFYPQEQGSYNIFDPNDDVDEMWPDPRLARENMGVNAYFSYDISNQSFADFSAGFQHSDIISSTMGDNPTPTVGRESKTGYGDFRLKLQDFQMQLNYLDGWQDIVKQDTGFKMDIKTLNANAEYDLHFGNLNVRPGISYQMAVYNDMPFLREAGQGFLNGEKELSSLAGSIRMDYTLAEQLRLIAAMRLEDYNTHDDIYLSYQFVAAYNLNDQHLFRAVYSRANRGPFIADNFANYLWNRDERPIPGYVYFKGQENLDLLTMDMFEFGYRVKPIKSVQADIEAYYTIAENYAALYPDSVSLIYGNNPNTRPYVRMSYQNIDVISKQTGVTAMVSWVANEDLVFKIHGTWQQTQLEDLIPYKQDETIQLMLQDAFLDTTRIYSENFPRKREDGENEWTPNFYGGLMVNYQIIENLNINVNSYYYSQQEFSSKYGTQTIDAKFMLNSKISYSFNQHVQLHANIRNPLQNQREFGYLDDIGPLYLVGLSLKL